MDEVIIKIEAVINTLNTIEVKGIRNLDALIGSIRALQQVRSKLTEPKEEADGRQTD